jgi:hypothetical protein
LPDPNIPGECVDEAHRYGDSQTRHAYLVNKHADQALLLVDLLQ